jgi:hypothetical protein
MFKALGIKTQSSTKVTTSMISVVVLTIVRCLVCLEKTGKTAGYLVDWGLDVEGQASWPFSSSRT